MSRLCIFYNIGGAFTNNKDTSDPILAVFYTQSPVKIEVFGSNQALPSTPTPTLTLALGLLRKYIDNNL